MIVEHMLERRRSVVLKPRREAATVLGEVDCEVDDFRVRHHDRPADDRGQVRDVDMIGLVRKQPIAASDQVGDRGAVGRLRLSSLNDVVTNVSGELLMEMADQSFHALGPGRRIGGAELL